MKSLVNDVDDADDDADYDDDDVDEDDDDELLMPTYTFQITNLCVLPESGFLIDMMVIIMLKMSTNMRPEISSTE